MSWRTFTRRLSIWQPEVGSEVYLLGHEELQATARAYLGDQRLTGCQDRLHVWRRTTGIGLAGRHPGIPVARLLPDADRHRRHHRLAACATDAARHERMLDITGGDAGGGG